MSSSTAQSPAPDGDQEPGARAPLVSDGVPEPAARPPRVPEAVHEGARARVPEGAHEPSARGPRLIQNESTTRIPVHLLFRDDPDTTVTVPLPPAVVPGRPGAGGRAAGTPGSTRTGAGAATWPGVQAAAGTPAGGVGEQSRTGRRIPSKTRVRAAPTVDPDLTERPGPALPGVVGVLAGAVGLAGSLFGLWWAGFLPPLAVRVLGLPWYVGAGLGLRQWALITGSGVLALFGFGGLTRGRVGRAWVLSLFGRYRGSVRRTGLVWVSPLLLRRDVDVRLRHWRSEPMPAVDAHGVALWVVVLVVWQVKDTARAALTVADHQEFLRGSVESALVRVLSQLPADAPLAVQGARLAQDAPTLRNAEAVGDALTRLLAAEVEPVGIEVFSAQPTRIEYAPEVAAAMQRRRIAALDAQHRDSVLTSVVDSVEDTVTRLTLRGLVELDDYERKALVKDLTVAFCTGRGGEHS
ncbi:SPFH domain-containing protein [Streptomyces sp. NPDC002004]